MKIIINFAKRNLIDVVLVLTCVILLSLFGHSFGVQFICLCSLIFIILRRINFSKHTILRGILITILVLGGVSFVITEGLVVSELGADDSHNQDIDYVVVFGAGLRGSKLSLTLKQRLDTSLNYLSSNKHVLVVVSGGQGKGEDIPEAEAMASYLIDHGISRDRIILESKSTTTEENLLFTKTILADRGMQHPRIMIVTSDYHMYRAKLIAKKVGLFHAYGIASKSPLALKMNYMLREYFAMIKTLI